MINIGITLGLTSWRQLKLSDKKPCPLPLSYAPAKTCAPPPSTTISCLTFCLFHSLSCLSATPSCSLHDCSHPHPPPPLKLTSFPLLLSSFAKICPFLTAYVEVNVNMAVESQGQEAGGDQGDKDCDRHGHMHMYEHICIISERKWHKYTH